MQTTNRFKSIINLVKDLKDEYQTGRNFHCSIALKGGNIVSIGFNKYDKLHPYKKYGKYKSTRTVTPVYYQACTHSEIDLLEKLRKENYAGIHKLTLLNVRIDNNGEVANAMPCPNCQRVLSEYKFKKVFFTINENTIGKLIKL